MDFQIVKILALGAAIGFARTTLRMLKAADYGKLDSCEYLLILLKKIWVLLICVLVYVGIPTALLILVGSLAHASRLLNLLNAEIKFALLLLTGYLSSTFLAWFTLNKNLRPPLSRTNSLILEWRQLFYSLRDELKLRLIQLHAGLMLPQQIDEKLYPFYLKHRVQIANDLDSPKAREVHPKDHPLLTLYLVAWQGYYETARMLGKTDRFRRLRLFLCPSGILIILAVIIYLLYYFGFFHV